MILSFQWFRFFLVMDRSVRIELADSRRICMTRFTWQRKGNSGVTTTDYSPTKWETKHPIRWKEGWVMSTNGSVETCFPFRCFVLFFLLLARKQISASVMLDMTRIFRWGVHAALGDKTAKYLSGIKPLRSEWTVIWAWDASRGWRGINPASCRCQPTIASRLLVIVLPELVVLVVVLTSKHPKHYKRGYLSATGW